MNFSPLFFVILFFTTMNGFCQSTLIDEFHSNVPKRWGKYLQTFESSSYSLTCTVTGSNFPDPGISNNWTVKRLGDLAVWQVDFPGCNIPQYVSGCNKTYSFFLERQSKELPLAIKAIEPPWNKRNLETAKKRLASRGDNSGQRFNVLDPVQYFVIMSDFGFLSSGFDNTFVDMAWDDTEQVVISRIFESESIDGHRLVSIVASFAKIGDFIPLSNGLLQHRNQYVKSGTITFDANNNWLPVSADLELSLPLPEPRVVLEWAYSPDPGSWPLKSHEFTMSESDPQPDSQWGKRLTYDFVKLKQPQYSEFTLSHYGLPEPKIKTGKSPYVWIVLLMAVLVMAFFGRNLLRKKGSTE